MNREIRLMFVGAYAGAALFVLILFAGVFAANKAFSQGPAAVPEIDCSVCDDRCQYGINPDFAADSTQSFCNCTYSQRKANVDAPAPNTICKSGPPVGPGTPGAFFCCPSDTKRNQWQDSSACNSTHPDLPSGFSTIKDYCEKSGILPICARTKLGCTRIEDFVLLLIRYGRFIFGLAGSIALLFIVYGGLLTMFSFGNSEQVEKGKKTLTAAVVGLIIVFAAYLIIALIVKNLGVAGAGIFGTGPGQIDIPI